MEEAPAKTSKIAWYAAAIGIVLAVGLAFLLYARLMRWAITLALLATALAVLWFYGAPYITRAMEKLRAKRRAKAEGTKLEANKRAVEAELAALKATRKKD